MAEISNIFFFKTHNIIIKRICEAPLGHDVRGAGGSRLCVL